MEQKIAIFIGIEEDSDIVTGGERQLQELIKGLKRHGFEIIYVNLDEALNKIEDLVLKYDRKNIYVFSDYSKRFSLLKINHTCRKKYELNVICTVGAFYFDYRTSKLKNFIDYIVSYYYLAPANLIFTTGKAVEKKLRNMGCRKKKIANIYPAIRESLIEESEKNVSAKNDEKRKIVLTVGRFHPVKGYDYLLDAIKFCKKLTDVHFLLVGDYERKPDDYYNHIKRRIEEEGIEDRITIYGKTKDDVELASLYRNCWCYLHTSVWETSPITVCEPLLFGKPVIATDVGGTSEYLLNQVDSILVEAKTGNVIADAIKCMYYDEMLYKKLKKNAVIRSDQYKGRKWHDVGEEYYNVIMDNNK